MRRASDEMKTSDQPHIPATLLGMKQQKLTIMFVDIAGFTTISEKLAKRTVVDLLFQWFEVFTNEIHQNHGTVDKYIGDCIMALWGAPIAVDNPEYLACTTALHFNTIIETLNKEWALTNIPHVSIRVGIHCGDIYVGNIGCEQRVNYTVCGTVANISARLEQLGKIYGLTPLLSGDTYDRIKNDYLCVWLDNVILRGHTTIITTVYHLLAPMAQATTEQLMVAETMNQLRESFNETNIERRLTLITEAQSNPYLTGYFKTLEILKEKSGAP
jgi:adenylate cyclase